MSPSASTKLASKPPLAVWRTKEQCLLLCNSLDLAPLQQMLFATSGPGDRHGRGQKSSSWQDRTQAFCSPACDTSRARSRPAMPSSSSGCPPTYMPPTCPSSAPRRRCSSFGNTSWVRCESLPQLAARQHHLRHLHSRKAKARATRARAKARTTSPKEKAKMAAKEPTLSSELANSGSATEDANMDNNALSNTTGSHQTAESASSAGRKTIGATSAKLQGKMAARGRRQPQHQRAQAMQKPVLQRWPKTCQTQARHRKLKFETRCDDNSPRSSPPTSTCQQRSCR